MIWSYERGYLKGYSQDFSLIAKITSWRDVEPSNYYYTKKGKLFARDFVFPSNLKSRVEQAFIEGTAL